MGKLNKINIKIRKKLLKKKNFCASDREKKQETKDGKRL